MSGKGVCRVKRCYDSGMADLIRFEMHVHSIGSHDSLMQPGEILERMARLGIEKVAITDHNSAKMGIKMHEMFPDQVVPGEEILTTQGELLAYYIHEEVPPGLIPRDAIARLKEQGAFISVAHPFERQRNGWSDAELEAILPLVDAVEVFNARCLNPQTNEKAAAFALEHALAGTAGSDAHTLAELGHAVVRLPDFKDAAGLRVALAAATVEARLSPFWVHFGSRWADMVKRLGFAAPSSAIDE